MDRRLPFLGCQHPDPESRGVVKPLHPRVATRESDGDDGLRTDCVFGTLVGAAAGDARGLGLSVDVRPSRAALVRRRCKLSRRVASE
jgi:hypothetical protein